MVVFGPDAAPIGSATTGTRRAFRRMVPDVDPAVRLIKSFEGIEDGDPSTVNLDPYICPAGYWTIGWGHAVVGPSGLLKGVDNKAAAHAVYPNGLTRDEASTLLTDDVRRFSTGVDNLVTVKLGVNQFCALVCFSFNVGLAALKTSTLLSLLNQSQYDAVPAQLRRWNKAGGKVLAGLTRRREAEAQLWNTPDGQVPAGATT